MSDDLQNKIFEKLNELSAKLGVAAQHIYALYLKQARIDGFEYAFGAILLYGFAALLIVSLVKDLLDDEVAIFFEFAGVICGLVCGTLCVYSAIDNLANPGLAAFQNLLTNLK